MQSAKKVALQPNTRISINLQQHTPTLQELLDFDTIVSLFRLYGKQKSLWKGEELHNYVTFHGYDRHTFLSNAILHFYANCGRVHEARNVFKSISSPNIYSWNLMVLVDGHNGHLEDAWKSFCSMPKQNIVSWNVIIGSYIRNGNAGEALNIFHGMLDEGFTPDIVTFVTALDACSSLAVCNDDYDYKLNVCNVQSGHLFSCSLSTMAQRELYFLHHVIAYMTFDQDIVIGNAVINVYGKCGHVQDGLCTFHAVNHHNVITWTTMISTFSQNGFSDEALELFKRMHIEGMLSNNVTIACALDACADVGVLQHAKHMHAVILNTEYKDDLLVGNALVNTYGKCKSVQIAEMVFAKIQPRDVVSWNTMMATFSQNSLPSEALKCFQCMQLESIKPDCIALVSAVDACASLAILQEGYKLHTFVVMVGFEQLGVVGSSLISMYGNCGAVHEAQCAFQCVYQKDLVSWNAIIFAYALNEFSKEALQLFEEMQSARLQADKITYCAVLDACANIAALGRGREIHSIIDNHGYGQDVMIGTALLDMYGKCGSISEVKSLLKRMPQKNIVTWTAVIAALAQNGDGQEALNLFAEMQFNSIEPVSITFISIFNACNHVGLVEDGIQYFLSMKWDYGLDHTLDHYLTMIDLLGRAGCLDKAELLIHGLPNEEVGIAWECLLSSCRIHSDCSRGLRAACHCFELNPKKAAPLITLDNIWVEAITAKGISVSVWEN